MHPFLLAGIILHTTGLAILGFFVLFAASKAEGLVKTIGNILGIWLFTLIVFGIIGFAVTGGRPFETMMRARGESGWMGPWSCPAAPSPPPQTKP